MSLSSGAKLGRYEIRSKIGEGGMGEVYLAVDEKLGRKVALKILPAELASNQDRMRRFTQEAKAAAALNHPNIAHIYEIGESEGTHYIAMEFIDGETLHHEIHRNKAPLSKLLKYLIQVAHGLSKAHAAGIVHRDLKPDNIMITRDDYAKVLDFGLAKLVEPQRTFGANESGSSEIATAVMQQPGWDNGRSTPGMVLGTIGYMSPEQASGRVDEIDLRSDIFSFGCILFEAATGQRAFAGKDVLDSLHKIVHAPTPQLKVANPLAPPDLQRVVRRCLAKEREKRYQSIKEVAIELDDLQQEVKGLAESEYSGHPAPAASALTSGMMRADEGFWVAVLPFRYRGSNVDLETLAEGLSEEIVTGLARFSYLRVTSRSSTSRYASESDDVRAVGKTLQARYVMEGSLRLAGSMLRVAVQLVDASTGAHLWAETYDRPFGGKDIFALQDDLVPRIVSTVADQYGALVRSMSEALRGRSAGEYSAHEAVLRAFGYWERVTMEEHREVREILQAAVARFPGHSDCLAELSLIYWHEYAFGYNLGPDPLGRARATAQRAIASAPNNQSAHCALATALFFQKDFLAFRTAAEHALALNRMDSSTTALLGTMIAYAGDWEYGLRVVERAMELNPHHPGWYHYLPLTDAYRRRDYRGALENALKVNMPGYYWPYAWLAAIYGQLGDQQRARAALRELDTLLSNFGAIARAEFSKWHDPELTEHLLDGLRKAGLEIRDEDPASTSSTPSLASSESRADEGFWIAVLPFKYTGSSTEVATLAEGLTEEIVTGLSRFSYLRVISRSSTLRYATETPDVRTVGKTLGARYVLEGSLRIAGSSLRVAVQLVDSSTGAHLWVETYRRSISTDDLFELQDDLASRIVSSIADMNGVLPRTLGEMLRQRDSTTLTAYESVLRAFAFIERLTAEEHLVVRAALERAVEQAPDHSDCLAMLAMIYVGEYVHGFNPQPNSLERAFAVAQRAVAAGRSNHIAQAALAQTLFFRRDLQGFRSAANRALALNPMDAYTTAFMGILIAYAGDWEPGCALAEKGMELNPNHPGWYRFCAFFKEYGKGDYRAALDVALKINMPSYYYTPASVAMAYAQLGELAKAQTALRELLTLVPNFAMGAREAYEKWFGPGELLENVLDGLRKAGLEV